MTEKTLSDPKDVFESEERLREDARERVFIYRAEDEDLDLEPKTHGGTVRVDNTAGDDEITEDVTRCLASLRGIDPERINALVRNGRVVLTGSVVEEAHKRTVETAVANVMGVYQVENQLVVWR